MKIKLHRNFVKKYTKLNQRAQCKFKERRNLLVADPDTPILRRHPLSGSRKGQWSINVTGDLRAIYIYEDKGVIIYRYRYPSNLYE